jgi:hypothetical protein
MRARSSSTAKALPVAAAITCAPLAATFGRLRAVFHPQTMRNSSRV